MPHYENQTYSDYKVGVGKERHMHEILHGRDTSWLKTAVPPGWKISPATKAHAVDTTRPNFALKPPPEPQPRSPAPGDGEPVDDTPLFRTVADRRTFKPTPEEQMYLSLAIGSKRRLDGGFYGFKAQ
eukprot:tig00001366_g8377.t1